MMTTKYLRSVDVKFSVIDPTTGGAVNAPTLPTCSIYRNNNINPLDIVVAVTNTDTDGLYNASFTISGIGIIPTDRLACVANTTISGISGVAPVWQDEVASYDFNTILTDIDAQLTANHGVGLWVSGASATVDNDAVAAAVDNILTSNHGLGLWVSGTGGGSAPTVQEIDAQLTANHGLGIWVSGTAIDNDAIASAVDAKLLSSHGSGIWASGIGAADYTDIQHAVLSGVGFTALGTTSVGDVLRAINAHAQGNIDRASNVFTYYDDDGVGTAFTITLNRNSRT